MRRSLSLFCLLILAMPASAKPVIQASNYPLAYFAQRIAGDRIDVQFLAPPDEDPAFWEPSDLQIAKLQNADKVLLNGATYEKWLSHVSLPDSILVDTSEIFAPQFIEVKESSTHSHGKEGSHSHAGTAFTTWIDFAQSLFAELDDLDRQMMSVSQEIGQQPILASHPVYHYLARRYRLQIESVLWEPETIPDEAAIRNLRALLTKHPAKWMIWESSPAGDSIAKLKDLGIGSVVFDPCANRPEQGDWLSVMRQNVANLKTIVAPK